MFTPCSHAQVSKARYSATRDLSLQITEIVSHTRNSTLVAASPQKARMPQTALLLQSMMTLNKQKITSNRRRCQNPNPRIVLYNTIPHLPETRQA